MNHATSHGFDDVAIRAATTKALELVVDGARVGLGSGRAARAFISALGARQRHGFRVDCVPTSRESAEHAMEAGLQLVELDATLDLTVDGADEVSPDLDLIKGAGGAFVRERIVAAASRRQVILVSSEKIVESLGERMRIPVEVVPLARWWSTTSLESLGLVCSLRRDHSGRPFVSENGNNIIDCALPKPVQDRVAARTLERAMLALAGVVDTGLFLGTADVVFVGYPDGRVETRARSV